MKNKCFFCNKNINLIEFTTNKCRCNNIFCTKHFFYTNHNCNFDYNLDNINKMTSNIIKYSDIENKIIKI
jgi:predicted nucleic acid binding AN1-type Zn finger protein